MKTNDLAETGPCATVLATDGETRLLRVTRADQPFPILFRMAAPDGRLRSAQPLLQREHDLAQRLDPAWAVKPLDLLLRPAEAVPPLAAMEPAAVLMMADPGGQPLSALAVSTWTLHRRLILAVRITEAVAHLHRHRLLHRDLRPFNLLVGEDLTVRLTGFGLAGPMPATPLPEAAAASERRHQPAYMAPEQTGRMNRPVDRRSDLYALGVVLYELLAGTLPFTANDDAEWVHCHLTRAPVPPAVHAPRLAPVLCDILLRLLAKPAEDRYQSADGLLRDLSDALRLWEIQGHVPVFPIGQRDEPEGLCPPPVLYGREQPAATLLAAFQRVADHGRMGVVLVAGESGIGKSALVRTLQMQVLPPRGVFAAGKFDQGRRDLPYASLSDAFRSLVGGILGLPTVHQDHWRRELREAVGTNGALMTGLIPNLTLLIGEQPAVAALPPREAQHRFDLLFRRVLQVFARPDHPLALVLDDLQWLDRATLDLLDRLLASGGLGHLLLIGAYRSDEVGPGHPLATLIDRVRAADRDIDIEEIGLSPLSPAELRQLVADSLDRQPEDAAPLAGLLHDRTGGNAFFASQLLAALERSGWLGFDRATGCWTWDLLAIETVRQSDDIATLMTERLVPLPRETRCLLVRLACLGSGSRLSTLALASGMPPGDVERFLDRAVADGLLMRTGDDYRFLHDRVQEGAYALVPEDERRSLHLDIARALHADTAGAVHGGVPDDAGGDRLFEMVGQYDQCLSLIESREEREQVAALYLAAGQRAKAASAHGSALTYVQTGLSLLAEAQGVERHRLRFDLERLRAECEFLNGDLDAAERHLIDLIGRAEDPTDRAAITALLVTIYTAIDRSDRAIESCLSYLRDTGVDWPPHPPPELAKREYRVLQSAIGVRPILSLTDLPAAADPASRATLDVLAAALPPAFFSDHNLVCLILCRMANLSLGHGATDASALGFAYLGMVAGPYFGDYAAGYAFGRLGFELAERHGLGRYRARVLMTFAYHVVPWTRDARSERRLLLRAFEEARETGDVTYGGFTSVTLVTSMLASGDPLETVQQTAETRLAYVRQVRFGLCADILTTQIRMLRALRGQTDALGSLDGLDFDNAAFEARLLANRSLDIAICWHWIRSLQLSCIAGDMAAAVLAAERAEGLLWTTSGHLEMVEYHFHAGVARAALMDESAGGEWHRHSLALLHHRDQLRDWAGNNPDGFEARFALLEAEAARLEGRSEDAMRGFDRAVQAAQRSALPQVEALANERAAAFYRRSGLPTLELACLREAATCYRRWGATAKVRQIEQRHPVLAVARQDALPAPAPAALDGAGLEGAGFDGAGLATLLETLRAMSDQASVEQVTATLLTLVLEHAGASRGLLILARGEQLRVEAEATTRPSDVSVHLVREDADRFPLPHSMIHGAIRERQAMIVDDTRAAGPFSADPYFQDTDARSLLCMPLVRRKRVVGLLHLENTLATHAFTRKRIDMLTLLGAQAAAALETATLEEKEALLKEVHHRVKNNLQLVTSLLNLQANRIADKSVAALFADSRDRVHSMALVHESLYRLGSFARVPIRAHLESVCAHLLQAYAAQSGPVRLITELDDLKLDLDRAIPCGLIVNELVSNALKHAFPDGRGGVLHIGLAADGQDCRLSVRDDGVGLSTEHDIDKLNTVGLRLVDDLSSQLHGSLQCSSTAGSEFIVTFPLMGRTRGFE
ncbi:AAA family ATPase [Azospirillum picis]|uniref:ATPase/two-component sensor histidine kinase n=1 Tax=Azospirillum picis TaxID=488438 RepID=A0ABU0MN29_9PROT|nr:AAA family ATPase [Azospirillum picis]MBP2301168.1 putative ATPase/two-component sensor histidine kinase [Azospirillum picis]MDQ0534870.1 putative ATPase/two-component sensor histidine kinase [Azospirillum picis]